MNVESQQALILGVDTHLDVHVGVVINELDQCSYGEIVRSLKVEWVTTYGYRSFL